MTSDSQTVKDALFSVTALRCRMLQVLALFVLLTSVFYAAYLASQSLQFVEVAQEQQTIDATNRAQTNPPDPSWREVQPNDRACRAEHSEVIGPHGSSATDHRCVFGGVEFRVHVAHYGHAGWWHRERWMWGSNAPVLHSNASLCEAYENHEFLDRQYDHGTVCSIFMNENAERGVVSFRAVLAPARGVVGTTQIETITVRRASYFERVTSCGPLRITPNTRGGFRHGQGWMYFCAFVSFVWLLRRAKPSVQLLALPWEEAWLEGETWQLKAHDQPPPEGAVPVLIVAPRTMEPLYRTLPKQQNEQLFRGTRKELAAGVWKAALRRWIPVLVLGSVAWLALLGLGW